MFQEYSQFLSKECTIQAMQKVSSELDNIAEASSDRHKYCIDVDLLEERCRNSNSREYVDFGGLVELALITDSSILFDVVFDRQPLEVVKDDMTYGVEAFMSKLVMSILDKIEVLRTKNIQLVPSISLLLPELVIEIKEVHCQSENSSKRFVVKAQEKLLKKRYWLI